MKNIDRRMQHALLSGDAKVLKLDWLDGRERVASRLVLRLH